MKKPILFLITAGCLFFSGACTGPAVKKQSQQEQKPTYIMKEKFGTVDKQNVYLFTLRNKKGITVKITNYGGIITSFQIPDKNGKLGDIVLGYDSLKEYIANSPYFGAIVGRYANRIAKGEFTLDGKKYTLARNNGNNSLHGGLRGFDKVVWDAREEENSNGYNLILTYLSKDGEEGFPGNLKITVTYILNDSNQFRTVIDASTDKPTPVNLCNHSYFNLSECDTSILGHFLVLNADRYTVVNDELIPTGELRKVKGTPMDFTKPHAVGERIAKVPGGYDHNYVLTRKTGELALAAKLGDPKSGRGLAVFTTQPGIQFYSGNFLDGTIKGKGGKVYGKHWGLCLETQHFPDSPNQTAFPNTVLRPGKTYHEETVYRFGVFK